MEFKEKIKETIKNHIEYLGKEYLEDLREDRDFLDTIVNDIALNGIYYHNKSLEELTDYIKEDDQFFYECLEDYEFNYGEKISLIELMEDPGNILAKLTNEGVYRYLSKFSNFKELEKELLEQKKKVQWLYKAKKQ